MSQWQQPGDSRAAWLDRNEAARRQHLQRQAEADGDCEVPPQTMA